MLCQEETNGNGLKQCKNAPPPSHIHTQKYDNTNKNITDGDLEKPYLDVVKHL